MNPNSVPGALNPAAVAPKADVEAIAESETQIAADRGEPWRSAIQLSSGAAFRHQENPGVRDFEAGAERLDLDQIRRASDDEFEPCLGRLCEIPESRLIQAEGFGHAGIRQLWRNIELIHGFGELGRWNAGGVRLDFKHAFLHFRADAPDHFEKIGFLKQRFATRNDHSRTGEGEDAAGNFRRTKFKRDIGFPVFRIALDRVFFMRPGSALEIPGMIGIAPDAVQIAAGRADEDGRAPGAGAFALDRVENFRAVAEFCKFHGRPR